MDKYHLDIKYPIKIHSKYSITDNTESNETISESEVSYYD